MTEYYTVRCDKCRELIAYSVPAIPDGTVANLYGDLIKDLVCVDCYRSEGHDLTAGEGQDSDDPTRTL